MYGAARRESGSDGPAWIAGLLNWRPPKVVAIALANKMARIVYALLTKGTQYRKPDSATGIEPAAA